MATGIMIYKIISVAALAWEMIWLHLLLLYEGFWSYIYGSVNSAIDLWLDTVSRNISWNENGSFMGLYYVFCFIPRWWKSISRSKFWSGINVLLLGIYVLYRYINNSVNRGHRPKLYILWDQCHSEEAKQMFVFVIYSYLCEIVFCLRKFLFSIQNIVGKFS